MLNHLEISYDGDLIDKVRFKKGLARRPLWETLKNLELDQMIMWVDRFDSLCPISSEWALAQALEESAGIKVSIRTQAVRSVFSEVNRLIYLTTYLADVVRGLGLMQAYQQMMILREQVFQKQEEITGGRILPQVFRMGGVRRDLAMGDIRKVREFLIGWKANYDKWLSLILIDELLESRLDGLLVVSETSCRKKGIWGIIGKAAGVNYDSRLHQPHGAYPQIEINLKYNFPVVGDALARFRAVIFEISLALNLCEQLLNQISSDNSPESSAKSVKLNDGIFTGSAESAKGPVTSVVEIKGEKVNNLRILTVGQRIWPEVEEIFAGSRAEEFDLLWASLGVSSEESEI